MPSKWSRMCCTLRVHLKPQVWSHRVPSGTMSPENTIFLVKTNETRMSVSSGLVYIPPVITAEIFLVLCSVLVHPSHVSAGIALAFLAGAPVLVQLFLYLT